MGRWCIGGDAASQADPESPSRGHLCARRLGPTRSQSVTDPRERAVLVFDNARWRAHLAAVRTLAGKHVVGVGRQGHLTHIWHPWAPTGPDPWGSGRERD